MERLTEKAVGCFEYALKDHKAVPGEFGTYDAFFDYSMAVKCLGHYEDTGLEQEEIAEFMKRWERAVEIAELCKKGGIDHLLELKKAENEGRLVVLPCIPGSNIYYLNSIDREVVPMVLLGFDILPTVVMAQTNYGQSIPVSQFGETVFLTREEAEEALKGGEG